MWDVRDRSNIHTASEHHADVYGIANHPHCPFMLVSCSRDTSLRIWTIESLITSSVVSLASLSLYHRDLVEAVGKV